MLYFSMKFYVDGKGKSIRRIFAAEQKTARFPLAIENGLCYTMRVNKKKARQ